MRTRFCLRVAFGNQRVNGSQTLQKSAKENFYPTFSSFWHRWSWKTFLLVRCEILGLHVNPLTGDARYPPQCKGNLVQPIQVHLS